MTRTLIKQELEALMEGIERKPEFMMFLNWCGTPKVERDIPTQSEFAVKYQLHVDTLTDWKKRPGFWDQVRNITKEWGNEKTPMVVAAMYQKALKGDPMAQKLWLQYIERFSERHELESKNITKQFIITRGDDQSTSNGGSVPGTDNSVAEEGIVGI